MTTDQLLERLAEYGATRKSLAYDCRHSYLPHPTTDVHESGRGRGGRYEPAVVPRARMLYRLRKAGVDPRTIRLILFMRDGWGWDRLQRDCVTGARKVMGLSLNGLRRYAPDGNVDDFAVDEITQHQHKWLVSRFDNPPSGLKPTSQETTRFVIGMLGTGEYVNGASPKRVLEPLVRAFWPQMGRLERWFMCRVFEVIVSLLDLRSDRMLQRLEQVNAEQIRRSRRSFRLNLFLMRRTLRRLSRTEKNGNVVSTNLLTLCGQAKTIDKIEFGKCGMSMYQVFAAFVGLTIALDIAFEEFVETWRPMLPHLVNSLASKRRAAIDP